MGNGASSDLLQAENDRTFNALWVLGVEEGSFACECGDTDCSEHMELALIEYAAREDGHRRPANASQRIARPKKLLRTSSPWLLGGSSRALCWEGRGVT
jgi:hypothetical protein